AARVLEPAQYQAVEHSHSGDGQEDDRETSQTQDRRSLHPGEDVGDRVHAPRSDAALSWWRFKFGHWHVDLRPGNGAELRKSPAVPSHRPASTRPKASLTQTGPASTDTRIPDAEAFGLARGVWGCPAFLTLDFTPHPAAPRPSPASPPPTTGIPAPPPPHPPAPRFACRRSRRSTG